MMTMYHLKTIIFFFKGQNLMGALGFISHEGREEKKHKK